MPRIKRNYELDADRISESLFHEFGKAIQDKKSFNKFFDSYMGTLNQKQDSKLRSLTFRRYSERHPRVTRKEDRVRITELRTERLKELPKADKERFIYTGVRKAYTRTGRRINKTVFAEEIEVTIRGKKIKRYRDKTGRFVSTKPRL